MPTNFFVYITTNRPRGTLYIGVTSNLVRRAHEHRTGAAAGFTMRYNLRRLVWFETYGDAENAILRERRMKKWRRAWKLELIEAANPTWRDLYPDICR